jgi:hypothetical protein
MREHLKSAATSLKAVSRTNPYSRARIAVGQVEGVAPGSGHAACGRFHQIIRALLAALKRGKMALGTHRIKHDDGEDGVVTDGKIAIEITEIRYLKNGYMPAIDTLLWENVDWRSIGGDPEQWEQSLGNYMKRVSEKE